MATNNTKNKKYGANLDSDSGDELNNGSKYHLQNRRQGAQSLQIHYNDLSDDNSSSSSSSSSDDEERCEGCLRQDPSVETCNVYLCGYDHEFCDICSNQEQCPCHPEYARKPGY